MSIHPNMILRSTFLLGISSALSQAATISWGGAHFSENFSSDGTSLEVGGTAAAPGTGTVMFELGIFKDVGGAEWTPNLSNVSEWEDRWVPFTAPGGSGTSDYGGVDGQAGNLGENYFGNTVTLGSDPGEVPSSTDPNDGAAPITVGYQVYVWGFDSKTITPGTDVEWLLFTGDSGGASASDTNWTVPNSTLSSNATFTMVWDIQNATTAVVGQVTDAAVGGGTFSAPVNPANTSEPFANDGSQFAAIPEPTTGILLISSILPLLRRKRK